MVDAAAKILSGFIVMTCPVFKFLAYSPTAPLNFVTTGQLDSVAGRGAGESAINSPGGDFAGA